MIVITGAAGFIASALLSQLNKVMPNEDIIIVDNFSQRSKDKNYKNKKWISCIERFAFFDHLDQHHERIDFIFHLGARTDTAEMDTGIFDRLNLGYSKKIWNACCKYDIPMLYASSAATYGDGNLGYNDDHEIIEKLEPLNPYGKSKNDFDKWVLKQKEQPPFWAGLKFFNVFGPNEYHKGRMASVVFHTFNQIRVNKQMRLFKSHRPDVEHGQQKRDFIYVKDVVNVCEYLYKNKSSVDSGIYNVGSGEARTFEHLATAVFQAMGLEPNIDYMDMPEDIRDKYQYYTQANMQKLLDQGYDIPFTPLESAVDDYVKSYMFEKKYF